MTRSELKDRAQDAFTPEMMKLSQATWIETFLEGVIDLSTGLTNFKDLAWFAFKVCGVMFSVSACEHCWSIEELIHSRRRDRLGQQEVVRANTTLLLRESLISPFSFGHGICHPRNDGFECGFFLLIPTYTHLCYD